MELVEFLLERDLQAKKRITISGELKDFQIEIKPINAAQWESARRKCVVAKKDRVEINQVMLNKLIVLDGCAYPNFREPSLLQRANVTLPVDLLDKVLKPGEIEKIAEAILDYSGFGEELDDIPKK